MPIFIKPPRKNSFGHHHTAYTDATSTLFVFCDESLSKWRVHRAQASDSVPSAGSRMKLQRMKWADIHRDTTLLL
jgi:hypothetical protein